MNEINLNCPCGSTKCSVKGNCKRCFAKHRNSRTSCIKKAMESNTINVHCPKEKESYKFGDCSWCRETAEKSVTQTYCQELGYEIYNMLNENEK